MGKEGINYFQESEKYRPKTVRTLLIAEAPPPMGTKYFYVPIAMPTKVPVERDASLPATIFHHYFQKRPNTVDKYIGFLNRLRDAGGFGVTSSIVNSKVEVSSIKKLAVVLVEGTLFYRILRIFTPFYH